MVRLLGVLAALCSLCLAQSGARSKATRQIKPAWIYGTILSDVTGSPLSRARVLLKSVNGEAANVAVEAADNGTFIIPNIIPGKYSISAQRDGYLPGAVAHAGGARLPAVIQLDEGQTMRDVTFRLKRWSVIAGLIRFNDAEPAAGVLVQVFQDAFARGRRSFRMISFTRTNDRGEYRISGIVPGSYYVAATYDRPLAADFQERDPVDESGKEIPQFRYSTTFYPGAQKLADAVPIHVRSAEEAGGIDIFLQPVRTLRISGIATSGLTGEPVKTPNVNLRRLSADERSSINAAISISPRGEGFQLRGVAPGPYLLVADTLESNKRLFTRVPIVVTDANIDDLHLLLAPETAWRGSVKVEDAPNVRLDNLRVQFEPRSDLNPITAADVRPDGTFTINVVPDEVYDPYMLNAPDEVYIKSVRVGNSPIDTQGISGHMAGASVPVEITLSGHDGVIAGRALNADGSPATGATITVVPDPPNGRPQFVKTGHADEYAWFQIRGLAPGNYKAFAYYDQPPCEFFDAAAVAECSVHGTGFTASEATQTVVAVRVPAE